MLAELSSMAVGLAMFLPTAWANGWRAPYKQHMRERENLRHRSPHKVAIQAMSLFHIYLHTPTNVAFIKEPLFVVNIFIKQ